ncbi:metallophosphoesterase family protein [Apilactobacillus ozensis]|uniref:metallophosphoesterase family protein n=1 Tax=Apilactobacillus ozensis TaxID=866801 RepID=UPI00200A70F1|nr:DNA repair exonuclease [Apilactobacillus ozensis]MCK8606649.1 DNA repair exonuclease [Apilactobacillus ozensis]
MKFIHTADLHLESPFRGILGDNFPSNLKKMILNSTFNAFTNLVNDAISKKVDFILIVGDIFDIENPTPKAKLFLQEKFQQLNEANISVFMSYGNHDYHANDLGIYPKNVYVFPEQVTNKIINIDNKTIGICGFSYTNKWISEKKINEYPIKKNIDYQIGTFHGEQGNESNYASFMIDDLLAKHYDYWALGHIHKRQQLNVEPPVWYSGNIQGRHKNENGDKGYLLVDTDNDSKANFISTSVIDWNSMDLKVDDLSELQIKNLIIDTISKQQFSKTNLLEINLYCNQIDEISSDDLLEIVQDAIYSIYTDLNAWVYNINLKSIQNSFNLIGDKYWKLTESKVFNNENILNTADSLFKYPFINDHFSKNESIEDLNQSAKNILMGENMKGDE